MGPYEMAIVYIYIYILDAYKHLPWRNAQGNPLRRSLMQSERSLLGALPFVTRPAIMPGPTGLARTESDRLNGPENRRRLLRLKCWVSWSDVETPFAPSCYFDPDSCVWVCQL